jgi:hypothetical protein
MVLEMKSTKCVIFELRFTRTDEGQPIGPKYAETENKLQITAEGR